MLHLFLALLISTASAHLTATANVYHQIIPLLTKKINPEQPTEQDQHLLNGAHAFMVHGTNHSCVNSELIQAISSVDFFSEVLPRYMKTNMMSGQIQAALIVAQMSDDIPTLHHRQAIIQHFNTNPETFKIAQSIMSHTAPGEQKLLCLFKPVAAENQAAHDIETYKTSFSSNLFKSWNNKYILGGFKRIKQLDIVYIPTAALTLAARISLLYFRQGKPFDTALSEGMTQIKNLPSTLTHNITNMIKYGFIEQKITGLYLAMVLIGGKIITTIDTISDFKIIHEQQKSLIAVAQLIKSIQKISALIAHDPELFDLLKDECTKLQTLFDTNNTITSSNLKYVVKELLSSSFTGESSLYFSKQGKILATHYYLNECRGELVPYLEALGRIDAFLSATKLYQEFQNHSRVTFCLPTFVDAPTPALGALEFWHPLINPDVVVPNDIIMSARTVRNAMITGPNAGGKTTSLMALIINIIFAQSFGIAPSKALTFTPFSKIHSYLDITTNLQEGLSLFAAELDRAKKLKASIASCTPGQKTFTIIDEIFSGTDPKVASEVGSKFAKQLGEIAHSMTIITTHFPKLTEIEQENGSFTNYKVADATIMNDGSIVYPF